MMQCRGMEARRSAATRSGSALVAVSILVVSLAVLSMGVLTKSMASIGEQRTIREELAARYVAEAALGDAVYELARGAGGALGTQAAPVDYGNASYWVTSIQNGNITSLVATGVSGLGGARVELVVRPSTGTLFSYAAFGGDSLIPRAARAQARMTQIMRIMDLPTALLSAYWNPENDVGCPS